MKTLRITLTPFLIFILALCIYWPTSYPSITWWDSSDYSTAAVCLGLASAPGSLLLTFLGWMVSKFAAHDPAYLFNLLAGVIAAAALLFAFRAFKAILALASDKEHDEFTVAENAALLLTSGIVICSTTLWEYATMFTPYILTALFTLFILLAVLRWWRNADHADSWKSLFIVTLLLGVDFSVHRTNAMLIPGILVMMIIRRPKTFLDYRSYLAALTGMLVGLSIQLLYIPMSLNDPQFNLGETNTVSAWWDFISLKMHGGGFLMDIFVRKGPFWTYQVPYYFQGFADNFFYFNHTTIVFGFVPVLLGCAGIVYLFKTDRKLALALVALFVLTIAALIIQFNLPVNYFRSIYRHYLPTYVIFSIFMLLGTHFMAGRFAGTGGKSKWISISVILLVLTGAFLTQYITNKKYRDGSRQTFAFDYAENIINSVGPNGILINHGDNQHFTMSYLQVAEKLRPDIHLCNIWLLNVDWYIEQNIRNDAAFPLTKDAIAIAGSGPVRWTPCVFSIPVTDSVKMKYAVNADTVHLLVPAIRNNVVLMPSDIILFELIKNNAWKRPIYIIRQGFDPALYTVLRPYLRDEGLVFHVIPDSTVNDGTAIIENNLPRLKLSGYNDSSITLDDVSIGVGRGYYDMFYAVAKSKADAGDWKGALRTIEKMKELLPFDRLHPDNDFIEQSNRLEELIKQNLK